MPRNQGTMKKLSICRIFGDVPKFSSQLSSFHHIMRIEYGTIYLHETPLIYNTAIIYISR